MHMYALAHHARYLLSCITGHWVTCKQLPAVQCMFGCCVKQLVVKKSEGTCAL